LIFAWSYPNRSVTLLATNLNIFRMIFDMALLHQCCHFKKFH
jgi:hypothetical protein